MEALRLEANALFSTGDVQSAAVKYAEALKHWNPPRELKRSGTSSVREVSLAQMEEYSKCAGNLCLCYSKLRRFRACFDTATAAVLVNPFLAKCHVFAGMSVVELHDQVHDEGGIPSTNSEAENGASPPTAVASSSTPPVPDNGDDVGWSEAARMHLCRGLFILPEMIGQVVPILERLCRQSSTSTEAAFALPRSAESAAGFCDTRSFDGCGTGVYARRALPSAAVLWSLTQPFSVAPYAETGAKGICAQCGAPRQNPMKEGEADETQDRLLVPHCLRCESVFYCSEGCCAVHAFRHREYECAAFQKLRAMMAQIEARELDVPQDFQELASHVITTRAAFKAQCPGYERLMQLEHHAHEVAQSLAPAGELLQDLFPDEDPSFLVRLLGAVRCNALEVCDATGLSVGQALHLAGVTSFLNHSCLPNCAIDHAAQCIRTIRPIAADEQLNISYIPQLYWSTPLRREGLAERFFFTCRCVRCAAIDGCRSISDTRDASLCSSLIMESLLTRELPTARPDATKYYHAVVTVLCDGVRSRDVGDVDAGVLDELYATQAEALHHLAPTHFVFQDLRNTITFVCSVCSRAQEALRSSLRELVLWEALVPGALPVKLDKVRNALQCVSLLGGEQNVKDDEPKHLCRLAECYGKLFGVFA